MEKKKNLEDYQVKLNKFECSIMMDKWTTRTEKMIINMLVNSLKGSLFLEFNDASDLPTNSIKMYSLFKSVIERIGPENVVQVVTNNAVENVKTSAMMMEVFLNIHWTPCVAHCVNLILRDILKKDTFNVFSLR